METENKLPVEFKAKFLAELRSGKYKQGTQFLYNPVNNSVCCLGVAGLLCGLTKEEMANVDIICITKDTENARKNILSKKALQTMGYPRILAAHINSVGGDLAERNDSGDSFAEIADYIEANL